MNETEALRAAINAALRNETERTLNSSLPGEIDERVAQAWLIADYDDAEEIADWLRAGCRTPSDAQKLEDLGLTAEQAKRALPPGDDIETSTLGARILSGALDAAEARRIIENDFWHK